MFIKIKEVDKTFLKTSVTLKKEEVNSFLFGVPITGRSRNVNLIWKEESYPITIRRWKINNNDTYALRFDSNRDLQEAFCKEFAYSYASYVEGEHCYTPLKEKVSIKPIAIDRIEMEILETHLIENLTDEEFEESYSASEGKREARIHLTIERNSGIVKKAKDEFERKYGKLFCEIPNCGFNFNKVYGAERASGFIEAHHKKPLSEKFEGQETLINDFLMVCSNCHRMIHRKPFVTEETLHELIKNEYSR